MNDYLLILGGPLLLRNKIFLEKNWAEYIYIAFNKYNFFQIYFYGITVKSTPVLSFLF